MVYKNNKTVEEYDVVVCGGGNAGFCAAVVAARHGASTCLIQDRPVFGGNSSSEIRVTIHGACQHHPYARETGIISELLIEERAQNHEPMFENGWINSIWDMVQYDMAVQTSNLTFHLNTSIIEVLKDNDRNIKAVVARVANAETEIHIQGKVFIDCTGDGVVAAMAGCEWRMGSEGRDEFDEPHAPLEASEATMGNSIHIKAKDMGRPVPFKLPAWAKEYDDASFFYEGGRVPHDPRGGFWWIEIGIPWHTIHDNEAIRHELTRHALGVWDWIKNKDPRLKEEAANYGLDWIGQVPGKRESRRIIGQYFMTEHDLLQNTVFDDEVAFGGWFLDLHTPGGLLAQHSEPASAEGYNKTSTYAAKSFVGPYGIPLRTLIAKDIDNLMMAGRCLSVTHAALGSVRVQGTTALMGQAVGTAASIALEQNIPLSEIATKDINAVQQRMIRDGCYLPNYGNNDTDDLARNANVRASSNQLLSGMGPSNSGWYYEQLQAWDDKALARQPARLERRLGQWIALGNEGIKRISVCLTNTSNQVQTVEAHLLDIDHIWDYRANEDVPKIATTTLTVPIGGMHWVTWELGDAPDIPKNKYVRLDLLANKNVQWHVAGDLAIGHMSVFEFTPGKMRRYFHGLTLSFQIEPAQSAFDATNIISGRTRPYDKTNLWRSAPTRSLPQWVEISWDTPQTIKTIDITFPGYIEREYHAYPPLYRDPQCAAEYGIELFIDERWQEVLRVTDNYHRLCQHTLDNAIETSKLRIVIYSTYGDSSAGIYEVRVYRE
jgi:hypothetical protein